MQQALAIAGLTFLTVLMVNYYNANSFQQSATYYNEAVITATGIGQSVLDEVKTRAFDENTVAGSVATANLLTTSANLGPDLGELNINLFDDVDDFNNYTRVVPTSRLGDYTVRTVVTYVDPANPGTISANQTFAKNIGVWVTNTYLTDSLYLNVIVGY